MNRLLEIYRNEGEGVLPEYLGEIFLNYVAEGAIQVDEQWREVLSHDEGYEVSDQGRVRSYRMKGRGEVLSKEPHLLIVQKSGGKPWVMLMTPGKGPRPVKIHNLVLQAFVGQKEPGQVARHLNGDSFDNRLVNLRWGSTKELFADLRDSGRLNRARGEDTPTAVLTNAQVVEAKNKYLDGASVDDLASEFGVSVFVIRGIMRGATWQTIGPDMSDAYRNEWDWLSDDRIQEMIDDIKSGMFMTDAAKKYERNVSSVSRVFERHVGMSIRDYRKAGAA